MSQIYIINALFWYYMGRVESSWYLCGDRTTDAMRMAHIRWCLDHGCNTVLLNFENEELMSLFKPKKFMQEWDWDRCNLVMDYILKIRSAGLMVAIALYDGPSSPDGKYHPILDCPDSVHVNFIRIICQILSPYVDLWLLGCETNRYWSSDKVEQAIQIIKQASPLRLVGTHEQGVGKRNGKWVMTRRVPRDADFHGHELSNHPMDGDDRSVADMVAEVKFLVANSGGKPIWIVEHNLNQWGAKGKAQSRAMAKINGVYGVPGP